jgi:Xylose isomerase
MDALAKSLEIAAQLIQDQFFEKIRHERYKGWDSDMGRAIIRGQSSLEQLHEIALAVNCAPLHHSGKQEWCENSYNQYLWK